MGRKQLDISLIPDLQERAASFNKRRVGLLKKAYELGKLIGVDISLIFTDLENNLFTYTNNSKIKFLLDQKYDKEILANKSFVIYPPSLYPFDELANHKKEEMGKGKLHKQNQIIYYKEHLDSELQQEDQMASPQITAIQVALNDFRVGLMEIEPIAPREYPKQLLTDLGEVSEKRIHVPLRFQDQELLAKGLDTFFSQFIFEMDWEEQAAFFVFQFLHTQYFCDIQGDLIAEELKKFDYDDFIRLFRPINFDSETKQSVMSQIIEVNAVLLRVLLG